MQAAEDEIKATGRCLPPRLHVVVDGLDLPYVGFLTCRPFYRGDDAIAAVGMMGVLGSMLGASRLVLTWEHQDMSAALHLPDAPAGQVVLDAHRHGGHVLRWHPVWIEPATAAAASGVAPVWGPVDTVSDAALPPFAGACLATWRQPAEWTGPRLVARLAGLERAGYVMRWVTRPDGEQHQPWWMPLLRPIM